jgi:hypothetical protein
MEVYNIELVPCSHYPAGDANGEDQRRDALRTDRLRQYIVTEPTFNLMSELPQLAGMV